MFLMWVGSVWAAGSDPNLAIQAAVAERLQLPVSDIEVTGVSATGVSATGVSATGAADWQVQLPSVGPLCGSTPVVIWDTTEPSRTRQVVRPYITAWQTLPVAAAAVGAGEMVTAAQGRVSCVRLRGEQPVDPNKNWQARVDLDAGAPLTTARVRLMPDAVSGTTVRIAAGVNGLLVVAPGVLSEDAFVGASVRVVNLATHVQLVGIYGEDGRVFVGGF